MRQLTFTFGGGEYRVNEARYKDSKKWRDLLEARLTEIASMAEGDLVAVLNEAAMLRLPENAEEAKEAAAYGEFEEAANLLTKLSPTLGKVARLALNSIEEAADLLFAYGELAEKREEIEEIAYDDEIIKALWVVVQAAYPFLTIKGLIQNLTDQFGQLQGRTSTNSPALNGAKETIKA